MPGKHAYSCFYRSRRFIRQDDPAEGADLSKVLANAAKAFEVTKMAERAQVKRMTDQGLLRIIATDDEIAKQISGC